MLNLFIIKGSGEDVILFSKVFVGVFFPKEVDKLRGRGEWDWSEEDKKGYKSKISLGRELYHV